jgi:hypothetical protein
MQWPGSATDELTEDIRVDCVHVSGVTTVSAPRWNPRTQASTNGRPRDWAFVKLRFFWDRIPTVWDETRVLDGYPGQSATLARRSGAQWFVVAITNNDPRQLKLSFDFLPKDRGFIATVYADDPSVETKTKVAVRTQRVDASSVRTLDLQASGGLAIWLRPAH